MAWWMCLQHSSDSDCGAPYLGGKSAVEAESSLRALRVFTWERNGHSARVPSIRFTQSMKAALDVSLSFLVFPVFPPKGLPL